MLEVYKKWLEGAKIDLYLIRLGFSVACEKLMQKATSCESYEESKTITEEIAKYIDAIKRAEGMIEHYEKEIEKEKK
jgi:hypothetical protein